MPKGKSGMSVPSARQQTLQMRDAVASQLGILDKVRNAPEKLTVQEAGALGGNIVRTLVKGALQQMAQTGAVPQVDVDEDNIRMVQGIEEGPFTGHVTAPFTYNQ